MIRPGTVADIPAVLALWQAAGSAPTVTDDEHGLRTLLAHDPGALLVAVDEEDGEVVGTLVAAWDGWRGHVYRMAVAPGRRRAGVAGALVEEGLRRLAELGCVRADAIVLCDEEAARSFWAAVGFHEQHDVRRWATAVGASSRLARDS